MRILLQNDDGMLFKVSDLPKEINFGTMARMSRRLKEVLDRLEQLEGCPDAVAEYAEQICLRRRVFES